MSKLSKKPLSFEKKQSLIGWFFCIPVLVGILFVFLPNLIMTIQFSLNDVKIVGGQGYTLVWKGIKYYKDAITYDPYFVPNTVASYKTLLTNVPVIIIFSMLIASLLNQTFRGRAVARAIFFIPVLVSTGILLEIENYIMGNVVSAGVETGGSLDGALTFNISELLTMLNFNDTLIGIIESAVGNIYTILISSGMQIYIFLAGIQEIPDYLYEAASIEGCSVWESFWKITFPMLAPQMAVNIVYTLVVEGQRSAALSYANGVGSVKGNYGLANAMSIIYLFTILILIGIIFWIFSHFSMLSNSERAGAKK